MKKKRELVEYQGLELLFTNAHVTLQILQMANIPQIGKRRKNMLKCHLKITESSE
jgi:hypothetical protein